MDFEAQLVAVELECLVLVVNKNCGVRHLADHRLVLSSMKVEARLLDVIGILLLGNCFFATHLHGFHIRILLNL
jgi:hypothetical protein